MEATALSAMPSRATTVPRPKVSWWTRSPGSSEGMSRAGLAFDAASARAAAEEKLRRPSTPLNDLMFLFGVLMSLYGLIVTKM